MPEEQCQLCDESIYERGKSFLWVMSHGWGIIGFYIRHENPLHIRVAHANFFRDAHVDYGTLANEGGVISTEWRYIGNSLITVPHIIRADEYWEKVPLKRIE